MGLWEITLRAQYDYPFIDVSREFPQTPISMWCLWNRELLQVPSRDPEVLRGVERAFRRAGRIVDEWVDARSARLFLLECTCPRYRNSPWSLIESHQCWDAPPLIYRDGWVNFRVYSFQPGAMKALLQDLRGRGPAELVRKRELGLSVLPTSVYADVLFGGLTRKQMDALLAAHRAGYYASPRQVTTEEIAVRQGIGRTTFEEHLRKAENRLLDAVMPHLELFATSERPPSGPD